MHFSFPSLACPGSLVRFEDKCYERVGNTIQNIEDNANACFERGGSLWTPQTSAEHHFVSQTFPSPNGIYHLGVVKYMVERSLEMINFCSLLNLVSVLIT